MYAYKTSLILSSVLTVLAWNSSNVALQQESSRDVDAVEGQHREFLAAWKDGDSKAASFFRDEAVYQRARENTAYGKPEVATLLSSSVKISPLDDGVFQAVVKTYWAKRETQGESDDRAAVSPLVTEEAIRYDGELKIVEYEAKDLTEESQAKYLARVKELEENLQQPDLPDEGRWYIGAQLILVHWQNAGPDRLWPHFRRLLEAGLMSKGTANDIARVKQQVERAAQDLPVPDEYRSDVERILSWKRSG